MLDFMAKTPKKTDDDERSPEDTERIADQTLKKLLNTPPKPFTKPSGKAKGSDKNQKSRDN